MNNDVRLYENTKRLWEAIDQGSGVSIIVDLLDDRAEIEDDIEYQESKGKK